MDEFPTQYAKEGRKEGRKVDHLDIKTHIKFSSASGEHLIEHTCSFAVCGGRFQNWNAHCGKCSIFQNAVQFLGFLRKKTNTGLYTRLSSQPRTLPYTEYTYVIECIVHSFPPTQYQDLCG
jgi:hypothetical protein